MFLQKTIDRLRIRVFKWFAAGVITITLDPIANEEVPLTREQADKFRQLIDTEIRKVVKNCSLQRLR